MLEAGGNFPRRRLNFYHAGQVPEAGLKSPSSQLIFKQKVLPRNKFLPTFLQKVYFSRVDLPSRSDEAVCHFNDKFAKMGFLHFFQFLLAGPVVSLHKLKALLERPPLPRQALESKKKYEKNLKRRCHDIFHLWCA
jgi:hypothetical protein